MRRFIEGEDRTQDRAVSGVLDDYIGEDNPVRVVDVFVDELDLRELGFEGAEPAATGRPAYHPATLLKIYIYGYLNRVQSSRRLEREAQRNVELMWLTGRLAPDFKTIADFRKDNGEAIRKVCRAVRACCAGSSSCSTKASSRSTAASSRRSTTATRTSRQRKLKARMAAARGEHRALPRRARSRRPRADARAARARRAPQGEDRAR